MNIYGAILRPEGGQYSSHRWAAAENEFKPCWVGRLVGLSHSSGLPATDFTQNFSYNPAGQLVAQGQAGAPYVWSGHPTTTSNFTHDALNRDAAIANLPGGYDSRGNLTADGTRIFTYDIENRLTGVSGGSAPVSIDYDPLGRIRSVTAGSTATDFLYDGSRLVGEYAGGTTQQLRYYAYGPGVDEPVVWIETPGGTWNAQAQAIHLHEDRLGSVVATSSPSGQVTPFTYGPYGEPQSWAGSRFRYTGQIALPEAQLYHYKARVYDPMVGRFLQTDPIGYGDGPNMYEYVGSDPIGSRDPTGHFSEVRGITAWGRQYAMDGLSAIDWFRGGGHIESSVPEMSSTPVEVAEIEVNPPKSDACKIWEAGDKLTDVGNTIGLWGLGLVGAGVVASAAEAGSSGELLSAFGFLSGNFGDLISIGGAFVKATQGDDGPLTDALATELTFAGFAPGSQGVRHIYLELLKRQWEDGVDYNSGVNPCGQGK